MDGFVLALAEKDANNLVSVFFAPRFRGLATIRCSSGVPVDLSQSLALFDVDNVWLVWMVSFWLWQKRMLTTWSLFSSLQGFVVWLR